MSVCLGYISPGTLATAFHESVINLLMTDNNVVGHISMVSGPRISSARNEITQAFLDHPKEPEWFLMLDADMVFDEDIIKRFLEVANAKIRPVVGGLCFGGGHINQPFPTLYRLVDPKTNGGRLTEVIKKYPKDALVKVDATGAAALFIHRSVLTEMKQKFKDCPDGYPNPHPWFAESVHKGHEYGEDWAFCMRLKAIDCPLYVHTGIKLGHMKSYDMNEDHYNTWRKNASNQERDT